MPLSYYLYTYVYRYLLQVYLRRDSSVIMDGFTLTVRKGVFHPRLFFSTRYFYDVINTLSLRGMHVLDIGCGSGALSLLAARKGATVTAIDISRTAVENTKLNFRKNFKDNVSATVLQSDLFSNLPLQPFDVIVINPPYFFKAVAQESENAWYCGPNGEYFDALFSDLLRYTHSNSSVFMVLADNCDIARIRSIAAKHQLLLSLLEEKKIKWETNYIFKVEQGRHEVVSGDSTTSVLSR